MRWVPDRSLQLAPASVSDYRELARRRLPRQMFDYIDGGAYAESTMDRNLDDLEACRLRQRVMRDVGERDLSVSLFDQQLSMPVALGPVGLAGMFASRAEVQAARAAESRGVPFCASTVSICGVEEIAEATSGDLWFQLYVMRDRGFAADLLHRADAAGCRVLVLTVDLPVVGARFRDVRNGMAGSIGPVATVLRGLDLIGHVSWVRDVLVGGKPLTFGNLEAAVPGARRPDEFRAWVDEQFDPSVTWDDLDWVRGHWPHRVVVKGVLDPEDAAAAIDAGVDGLVVSNHGGRQLDDVPSTASVLPAVSRVVDGRVPVLVDGGVRSGLDVAKMLALGADTVLLGRAWAWAVAARGQAGVEHVLRIIRSDLDVALGLLGVNSVGELGPDQLVPDAQEG